MNCPICSCGSRVEVNMKSEGFAQSMFECGQCGVLWAEADGVEILLSSGTENYVERTVKFAPERI